MFGLGKSPLDRNAKHAVVQSSNPFDSDDESDHKQTRTSARGISSEPTPAIPKLGNNPFDDDDVQGTSSALYSSASARNKYKQTRTSARGTSSEPTPAMPKLGTNPFDDNVQGTSSALYSSASSARDKYKQTRTSARGTSSEPTLAIPKLGTNPFDDDDVQKTSSALYSSASSARNKYKDDFRESGGIENQSVQELEDYAVYKAEETTKAVHGALKIAEEIREDATKTLMIIHQQGEQITRTHAVAADIDHDLSRGEKLLGSLGGIFSKTWKPKKTRTIRGPTMTKDDPAYRRASHLEQREKLGLNSAPKSRSDARHLPEPANSLQKVEVEKMKQDDALSDLSNIIGELKEMAMDMGSEFDRQNKAMDPLHDDVDEISARVKRVNVRARHLLRK